MGVLTLVLAAVSAVVFSMKRRRQKRKSQVIDSWIKALQEKQAEAKEAGAAPAVIEGVPMAPLQVTAERQRQEPTQALDQDMLNEMRKGPYETLHRAERIQREIRFSVQANHGPR